MWEGELCCFRSKILKILLINLLMQWNVVLVCTHVTHYHNYFMFQTLTLPFAVMTCGWKASLMSSFIVTPFVLLLGSPVVEIVPPVLSTLKGVTASFTCNVKGFPLPNIVWMKQTGLGESEISARGVNVQINSHNDSSQLIVQNTSITDSGYYICKASNFVSNTARAFLGVVCKFLLDM